MKIRNLSVGLASVILVLAGGLPLTAMAGPSHTYQTANIIDFDSFEPVAGAATLTRSKQSATARIYTSGLDTGAAYTIWWVVWSDPTQCVGACGDGDDDFFVPGNSVFYAGGFVTGDDGTANVTVHVEAGDLAEGIDVLFGDGLDSGTGFRAEIHMVIRTHGPIIPGMADIQIGTFFGACDPDTEEPCADQQAVIFAPVAP